MLKKCPQFYPIKIVIEDFAASPSNVRFMIYFSLYFVNIFFIWWRYFFCLGLSQDFGLFLSVFFIFLVQRNAWKIVCNYFKICGAEFSKIFSYTISSHKKQNCIKKIVNIIYAVWISRALNHELNIYIFIFFSLRKNNNFGSWEQKICMNQKEE